MEPYRPLSTKSKEQCYRFLVMLEDLCKHGSVLKEDCRCLRSISGVQEVGPNAIRRDLKPSRSKRDARHVHGWRHVIRTWSQKPPAKAVGTVKSTDHKSPRGSSTRRSISQDGAQVEIVYDCVKLAEASRTKWRIWQRWKNLIHDRTNLELQPKKD